MKIIFYVKAGCWLCDTAEEMLNGQRERLGLDIERIPIDDDEELYELYRFDVPVIEFPDGSTLHGEIKKKPFMKLYDLNNAA